MDNNQIYKFFGSFDLNSAKQICAVFEEHKIDFEVEIDDSPIRNMTPFQASLGGTYGFGASANIYVDAQSIDQCNALLSPD